MGSGVRKNQPLLHELVSSLHRSSCQVCMWGMATNWEGCRPNIVHSFHIGKVWRQFWEILHHRKFPAIRYSPQCVAPWPHITSNLPCWMKSLTTLCCSCCVGCHFLIEYTYIHVVSFPDHRLWSIVLEWVDRCHRRLGPAADSVHPIPDVLVDGVCLDGVCLDTICYCVYLNS